MIDVEQLLTPVSEDAPCGEDLAYDADLAALETLIQGKAETQFSTAEEPNWKEVQKSALALAERTRDLRVTIDLTLALLKLDDWPGFAQGTALLRGLHERYWEGFYPRLDPEDDNDPTERLNLLGALSAPEGTFGDPMRFLERLRAAPLCRGSRMGPLSLAAIAGTTAKKPAAGEEDGAAAPGPDASVIQATFQDTPEGFLAAVRGAVDGATADLAAIEEVWDNSVGSGRGPSLELLQAVLREAKNRFDTYAPAPVDDGATDGEVPLAESDLDGSSADDLSFTDRPSRGGRNTGRAASAPGEIASGEDVLVALDAICAYYDEREPSSPVPSLLRQARRLVGMNYFQIVSALTPDATPQVRLTAEEGDDSAAAPDPDLGE